MKFNNLQMESEVAPPIFPCPFSPIPSLPFPPSLAFSAEQPHPFASISSHVEGDPTVLRHLSASSRALVVSSALSRIHSLHTAVFHFNIFSCFRRNPSLVFSVFLSLSQVTISACSCTLSFSFSPPLLALLLFDIRNERLRSGLSLLLVLFFSHPPTTTTKMHA